MKELYTKIQELILENYQGTLDSETLDIVTIAVMALYVKNPEMVLERMPSILNRLDILAGKEKVSTYIMNKYPNYPWSSISDSESAMVVRALNTETKPASEDWTMAISTNKENIDLVDIIAKTIHELTHLLRFGGIQESKREIIVKDGICTARVDKKKCKTTKDHYSFEEGLVEKHTKETIDNFYEYLKSEKDLSFSPILEKFKRKFNGDFENGYIFEVSLIETLCMNPKIKELFEETFEINNDAPSVITYIDEVSKQRGMFSLLSNGLDRLSDCTHKGDINGSIRIISSLRPAVTRIVDSANKQYKIN